MTDSAIHTERPPLRAYPANVTFFDLIRANKRKSAILIVGMCVLLMAVGATFTAAIAVYATGGDMPSIWPSVLLGAAVAAIVGGIASAWSYFGGSDIILRISGAQEIPHAVDPQLHNVVEELAIAAGIPKPRVYLIDDTAMNAFATGRDPQHGVVAITKGLREKLSRDELAAVMAHEISHIRHYDIRFAMLMATMVGMIVLFSDLFWRILRVQMWSGAGRRSGGGGRGGKQGGNPAVLIILVIAILLAIIAPMLAMVIRFAVSRQREYLADAGAVELTRYPQGMISALEKLGKCKEPLEVANRATAHLYIVNPLKDALRGQGHELSSVFRTHPPLHERVERLRALIQ
jgi:heat shock protein HtpX